MSEYETMEPDPVDDAAVDLLPEEQTSDDALAGPTSTEEGWLDPALWSASVGCLGVYDVDSAGWEQSFYVQWQATPEATVVLVNGTWDPSWTGLADLATSSDVAVVAGSDQWDQTGRGDGPHDVSQVGTTIIGGGEHGGWTVVDDQGTQVGDPLPPEVTVAGDTPPYLGLLGNPTADLVASVAHLYEQVAPGSLDLQQVQHLVDSVSRTVAIWAPSDAVSGGDAPVVDRPRLAP